MSKRKPDPPRKFPVRRRKSQSQARRKAARRARNRKRKAAEAFFLQLRRELLAKGAIDRAELDQETEREMERLELRAALEQRHERSK